MRTSAGHGSTAYRPRRHFGGCFLIVMCCALQALVVSAAASADDHFFAGVREQTNPYGHLFEAPPITVPAPPVASSDDFFGQAQTPNQPPPVEHTGWATLIRSTGADFKAFPRRKSTWVILGIGAAAAGLAHPLDDDLNSHLTGSGAGKFFKLGKYLGYEYVLVGAALGTYLVGRYVVHPPEGKTNKFSHIGFDLLRANIVSQTFTLGIKYTVRRDRPTGECCAFPSGHASATFAAASVLERHFGYRNAWPTFLVAGYVAASRLHDNKHFLSDVLFGSALGMASGWTVVGRHGRDQFALLPIGGNGAMGVALMWKPADSCRTE
jgi:membrane-associated phospholipid phosphatase